jgi:hypothetical protein
MLAVFPAEFIDMHKKGAGTADDDEKAEKGVDATYI